MTNQQTYQKLDFKKVEKWGIFELTLKGTKKGNPFIDVDFGGVFKYENREIEVNGFYDGDGNYKIRFMPDKEGKWSYITWSNLNELDGEKGFFECIAAQKGNHGPVKVKDTYHFAYEDRTPYLPFGTTCYVWNHQGDKLEEQTLRTLEISPFNKIRMCVFPKHYIYNENEPEYYPFEGSLEEGWKFTRFNPEFFAHLEKRIGNLLDLGIEADLILFHPYDRWGFSSMDKETDDRYLKYIVARLAAYRNIWWSFANEFDLMKSKDMMDWDRFFQIVQECDPYQHLRSIHNCRIFYDHNKPWVTHCSVQHSDLTKVTEWRNLYGKPVVVDECCYEGNISRRWGNITGMEMVYRFWEGFSRGGYVGHGETFANDEDILWWSKGGFLHGESPKRIAFLRNIMEKYIKDGIDTTSIGRDTHAVAGKNDDYFLAYYGFTQPIYKELDLPQNNKYKIEIIDTWNMTVTLLEGIFEGKVKVDMPGKPYIALHIFKK